MSCSATNGDRELNNALMFFSSRDKGGRSSSRHDWLSCLEAVRPAPTIASMHQQILTQPHVTLKSRTSPTVAFRVTVYYRVFFYWSHPEKF